jgi:hypothetical protein
MRWAESSVARSSRSETSASRRHGDTGRIPERLGAPHVPDAGDEPLVEESVADLAAACLAAEPLDHPVELGRDIQDVRPEAAQSSLVAHELEHGPVPEDGLVLVAAQHEPRPAHPLRALPIDTPAAGHPQVAAQDEPTLEAEQEILADCFDALQRSAVQPFRQLLGGSPRMRRLDLDTLSRQDL